MSSSLLLQHLANAISLGSLYSLIAIGYTMVYGVLRLINFAHGDILMLAAYVVFYAYGMFHLPWPLSLALSVINNLFGRHLAIIVDPSNHGVSPGILLLLRLSRKQSFTVNYRLGALVPSAHQREVTLNGHIRANALHGVHHYL